MQADDLQRQQVEWLTEAYEGLLPIAIAITGNPEIGKEVVSLALFSALSQISTGKCRASEKGGVFAWVRKIVRNQSKTVIGAGKDRHKRRSLCRGDVLADLHAERVKAAYRRDFGIKT